MGAPEEWLRPTHCGAGFGVSSFGSPSSHISGHVAANTPSPGGTAWQIPLEIVWNSARESPPQPPPIPGGRPALPGTRRYGSCSRSRPARVRDGAGKGNLLHPLRPVSLCTGPIPVAWVGHHPKPDAPGPGFPPAGSNDRRPCCYQTPRVDGSAHHQHFRMMTTTASRPLPVRGLGLAADTSQIRIRLWDPSSISRSFDNDRFLQGPSSSAACCWCRCWCSSSPASAN